MIIAITGTPGTGKTDLSRALRNNGYKVVSLNKIISEKEFIIEYDEKRDTKIVDIKKTNQYIEKKYFGEKLIFVDGHLSHLLDCVKKVIILRCHPKILKKRLTKRDWNEKKIYENFEAEALDIILCETVEKFDKDDIFEIDTSNLDPDGLFLIISEIINNYFKIDDRYSIGKIDWSDTLLEEK